MLYRVLFFAVASMENSDIPENTLLMAIFFSHCKISLDF
ncbi:hypothetical protein HMPREF9449_01128 [Odoribacter laneus YIT 12061]|uniref:Uncharacterized protein n=1 Tax=Odoribacter laneus YIT 12061 TaxID=742817 RepID=H1DFU2_9BACT|nr:hypothetical protein HMPREF9449_01128 [Odoribacter laneus YIT 12061]CCZ80826.1 putative uncharacterized protein [Odoribacter laneus CAG:561]